MHTASDQAFAVRTLGEFLRLRRSRLMPGDVGRAPGQRRRTPGLRREEVADLAGIGTSWYTALEQGKEIRPSDQVLRNLSKALQLNRTETKHLFLLAGRSVQQDVSPGPTSTHPAVTGLLDALHPNPAFIADRRWDWVAWNPAADALFAFDIFAPSRNRNALRSLFERKPLAPDPMWEASARSLVARFRAYNASCHGEPWLGDFVQELAHLSDDFRRLWQLHDVEDIADTVHVMNHPQAGLIRSELVVLETAIMPDAWLVVFRPDEDGVRRLGLV